jgi:uncharacterized protein YjbI with pentapeptide repeats
MIKTLGKKAGFILAVAGAAVIGGATTALVQAAIPSTADGQIHACYRNSGGLTNTKGTLRVIDDQASQTCTAQESALNWSQGGAASILVPNLVNADLSSSSMAYWDIHGLNFQGTELYGADLKGVNATNANFTNSDLGANLSAGNFTNANFSGAIFGTTATRANFTGANFTGADWTQGSNYVNYANFTNVDLSNQQLSSMTATHAIFHNTNLSNTFFDNIDLTGSDFTSANLAGATWNSVVCPDGTNSDDHDNTCVGHLSN